MAAKPISKGDKALLRPYLDEFFEHYLIIIHPGELLPPNLTIMA